jgi:hypothetical protein
MLYSLCYYLLSLECFTSSLKRPSLYVQVHNCDIFGYRENQCHQDGSLIKQAHINDFATSKSDRYMTKLCACARIIKNKLAGKKYE